MKKFVSAFLIAVICLSFTACSSATPPASTTLSAAQPTPSAAESAPQTLQPVSIPQAILLDSNGIKITATGFEADGFTGPEMKLLLENSSGKNVTVQAKNVVVNGYMTDVIFSSDIAANKKANDAMGFLSSFLKECGIETITDISLQFSLLDTDNFTSLFESEPISIETTAKADYIQQYDATGTTLLEQDGIKVVYKALDDTSFMGPRIVLYLENNSQSALTIQHRDLSINGFMIMGTFSQTILPNTHAVTGITLIQSDLDTNSITQLQTAEFRIVASNAESWATVLESEPLTVTF